MTSSFTTRETPLRDLEVYQIPMEDARHILLASQSAQDLQWHHRWTQKGVAQFLILLECIEKSHLWRDESPSSCSAGMRG